MDRIKVLIVDDSKLIQHVLTKIINSSSELQVVGVADDAYMARDLIKQLNPDIITLDIHLPKMDGITFLQNLMRLHPMPVVMISKFTAKGASLTLEALSQGAVDYLLKPSEGDLTENLPIFSEQVISVILNAAKANVKYFSVTKSGTPYSTVTGIDRFLKQQVIAIGSSTGGIPVIETILSQLPTLIPPIVIVQHIRKEFVESFAARINEHYRLITKVADTNDILLPGHVYIAPGQTHLTIKRLSKQYICVLSNEPENLLHIPSVDVFFNSVSKAAGSNAIGILLTGMGTDGATGLKEILNVGGNTIVQDKESSVVWGMPGTAVKFGAAQFVLPAQQISQKIIEILNKEFSTHNKR